MGEVSRRARVPCRGPYANVQDVVLLRCYGAPINSTNAGEEDEDNGTGQGFVLSKGSPPCSSPLPPRPLSLHMRKQHGGSLAAEMAEARAGEVRHLRAGVELRAEGVAGGRDLMAPVYYNVSARYFCACAIEFAVWLGFGRLFMLFYCAIGA